MPDGSRDAHTPMSAEALDEAERQALMGSPHGLLKTAR